MSFSKATESDVKESLVQEKLAHGSESVLSPEEHFIGIPLHSISRNETNSNGIVAFRTLTIEVGQGNPKDFSEDAAYFDRLTFHKVSASSILGTLEANESVGLDHAAVTTRQARDGKNEFTRKSPNLLLKFAMYVFGGFNTVLILGVIVFFVCWQPPLSNPPSPTMLALAILLIIVILLQALFTAFQDFSTNNVMNSILNLIPSECMVLRDGEWKKIQTSELVVGDIVKLSSGDKVPADLRMIESSGDIRFDRAILTGESEEIDGAVDATSDSFLESRNIALMGTYVTNGSAKAVVVLTGANSVMGRISKLTSNTKADSTMIQKEISRFIKIIVFLTVVLATLIIVVWAAWLRVDHFAFINVVGLLNNVMGCVVAFIPEGMPMAVTLTLSLIARRMKSAKVLPKSLATVETLGCVNVICSDKTGTLTQNRMVVVKVGMMNDSWTSEEFGEIMKDRQHAAFGAGNELHRAATLCNDASFDPSSIDAPISERQINGNATDGAILRLVETVGGASDHRNALEKVFAIPFNSKNKWMLSMYREVGSTAESNCVLIKGAPDIVGPACTTYRSGNETKPLDEQARFKLNRMQEEWSREGLRVIALCSGVYTPKFTPNHNSFADDVEKNAFANLTFLGLLGIMDPPRVETAQTVADCRRAGSRFFMVTGDFGLTAAAIARSIGIITHSSDPESVLEVKARAAQAENSLDEDGFIGSSLVLEGKHLSHLSEGEWDIVCQFKEIVFARTTPEQKLLIVQQFKKHEFVVAVTGDGVNDAPALKAADVGVAVVTGSDVAIEAAHVVLMGNFDAITDAIRLGRLVFQNLQKVISYLLPAGSWSEIWPVLVNVFFGVPLPLSSFLMIVICVFTDLFLCLSLIMEREEFDLLSLRPRNHKKDHLINTKIYIQSYLFIGFMMTIIAHSMYFLYYWNYAGIPASALFFAFEAYTDGFYGYTQDQLNNFNYTGQSVYFVCLVILQLGNLLAVRNKRLSILEADPIRKPRRNLWPIAGAAIAILIAVIATEVPWIQGLFFTAHVPVEFWLIPIPLAFGVLMMDEVRKLVVRAFPKSWVAKIAW
ncbi:K, P-type ATPase [Cladochytrium replicatum]|nr:K, P-type ATPase [Cladochytrium replicatum]